jgi:G3E family GTPase
MALRVSVMNGLTSTYLENTSAAMIRRAPDFVGLLYSRSGAGTLRITIYDHTGVIDGSELTMEHECLSCLVREHTYEELRRLDALSRWSHALVTFPPGVDPGAFPILVEAFQEEEGETALITVDTAFAVVDALLAVDQLSSVELLREWNLSVFGRDERTIGEVLNRQVEFADRLFLANMYRLAPTARNRVSELLELLNPEADHVELTPMGIPRDLTPALGRFDLDAPRRQNPLGSSAEVHSLRGRTFQRLVWHRNRPMHPGRLAAALDETLPGSIRSRGQLWFATHPERQISWESSGPLCSIAAVTSWDHVATGAECFLVLVGEDLDSKGILEALDGTLLTDTEFAADVSAWRDLENPFNENHALEPDEER